MKAIHKFKGLTSKSRAATPTRRSFPATLSPEYLSKLGNLAMGLTQQKSDADPTQTRTIATSAISSPSPSAPRQKSNAEEAAELVEQRKAFMASISDHPSRLQAGSTPIADVGGEKGHAQDPTDKPPMVLGIGTGGHDDFSSPPRKGSIASNTSAAAAPTDVAPDEAGEEAYVVSDSPTGIDFDIYDRAFEAEVKRIRSQKTTRGRARTYLTRLVGEHEREKYANDESMVADMAADAISAARARIEDRINRRHGDGDVDDDSTGERHSGTVKDAVGKAAVAGSKFADLVTQMTKGRATGSGPGPA